VKFDIRLSVTDDRVLLLNKIIAVDLRQSKHVAVVTAFVIIIIITNMDIIKHVCAVKEANISIKDFIIRCCLNKDIQCIVTSNNVVLYDYLLHLCCFKQKTMKGMFLNTDNNKRT